VSGAEEAARHCSMMACEWQSRGHIGANEYAFIRDTLSDKARKIVAAAVDASNLAEGVTSADRSPAPGWHPSERWGFAEAAIRNGEVEP